MQRNLIIPPIDNELRLTQSCTHDYKYMQEKNLESNAIIMAACKYWCLKTDVRIMVSRVLS